MNTAKVTFGFTKAYKKPSETQPGNSNLSSCFNFFCLLNTDSLPLIKSHYKGIFIPQ